MDIETVLRIAACGTFLGHGWIAAWKLEFNGWKKFMYAAGFKTKEAHFLMPLIGWMDVLLAIITLLRPQEYFTAWMVVWAFSTALVRPVSAGWSRALNPLHDNALWGFVERAANWAVPLALLTIQKSNGYVPKELYPGVGNQLSFLDTHFNNSTFTMQDYFKGMGIGFLCVWGVVPFLRMRESEKKD